MILLVGGGASLAPEGLRRLRSRDRVAVLAREKPRDCSKFPEILWIPTTYSPHDESLNAVAELGAHTLIWLASPFPRGLFVKQSVQGIGDLVSTGIEFQLRLVQVAVPSMIRGGYGRLIFAGSRLASQGDEGAILYMVVKGAQKALARGVAMEYGRFGLTSNVIELGPLDSGYARGLPASRVEEYRARSARKCFVSEEEFWDLAEAIIEAPALNGAEIALDGGLR